MTVVCHMRRTLTAAVDRSAGHAHAERPVLAHKRGDLLGVLVDEALHGVDTAQPFGGERIGRAADAVRPAVTEDEDVRGVVGGGKLIRFRFDEDVAKAQ